MRSFMLSEVDFLSISGIISLIRLKNVCLLSSSSRSSGSGSGRGSGSGSGSKLLYLHDRKILQYCKSIFIVINNKTRLKLL